MRKYRAEQIMKTWIVFHKWRPKPRKLWKHFWKNRRKKLNICDRFIKEKHNDL